MKTNTKINKFISDYVKANHILEVSTLSDKLDTVNLVVPDKKEKPYDFVIGNATNNIRYERGQTTHTIYENNVVAHGNSNVDRAIEILELSLLKLEASTKDVNTLSIFDLVLPGEKYYIVKLLFGDRTLYCMGTKQNLDENLKTMLNVCEVDNYTLCDVANPYIVKGLLKDLHLRKDFKIFADSKENRISITTTEKSYNFIVEDSAFDHIIALALSKHLVIRPFHKGGQIIEQF